MLKKSYHKINIQILIMMLILFAFAGLVVSALTFMNLRSVYENVFSERVLISNDMIATLINGDDVEYYVDLLRNQDEEFKKSQYQFQLDREELYRLVESGASENEKAAVIRRMEDFHHKMESFKTERYWDTINDLKRLKEVSNSKYIYVFADTGVTDANGSMLYTYILDAEDSGSYDSPDSDGLGTVVYGVDDVAEIYRTKKQMEQVFYYNEAPYGELYFAYAPVLDSDGEVTAILGTDIALSEMYQEITKSMFLFNAIFLAIVVIFILIIYFFISHSVTTPLTELIETAEKLAEGNMDASVPAAALSQKSELGVLARVINDMGGVYQNMIANRAILDSNPFTCIIFDMEMNIIDCDPRALEFYQFESVEEAASKYQSILASSVPEYQPDGHKSIPFEERIRTTLEKGYCEFETVLNLHGRTVPLETIMKLIEYKNKPAIITYQFDLTAQKETQQALEYRSQMLQAVSDVANLLLAAQPEKFETTLHKAFGVIGNAAAVDRVYIWKNEEDDDGKLYMTQVYEWSPDAEPQQGNELTIDIPYDDVMPSWKETLLKGKCMNSIVRDLLPEEQEQLLPQGIVSLLLVPIFIQEKFWGFLGFDDCHNERIFSEIEENILKICGYMFMALHDVIKNEVAVSLMAAREEALHTSRAKSNFLANMSHEIRTPMNAILGMTELILIEDTSETVLNHAIDIKNACRSLLAIINDILDISKIESGKLAIIPVRYQVSSLLIDVIGIIKIKADAKRVSFTVNIDAGLPCELHGDEIRIRQILINLLNNAVKFTEKGSITLTVGGEAVDDYFVMKCSVADTGIGIKTEDMDNLFEMFNQVDTKKNRNIEGTGLGLSISRQLAEMMGGKISLESEYGSGSTFTVELRQNIVDSRPMAKINNTGSSRVLVYENRKRCLDSITYALDNLGCQYMTCVNQSELYGQLSEFKYDYIFAPSLYMCKVRDLALAKQPEAVVVGVLEESDVHPGDGFDTISMPIHSLQIANILNGEYVSAVNRAIGNKNNYSMVAPDARVLVVDDNIVNLKVVSGLLKAYEIQADASISGKRAMQMVEENIYDLIFMDHMMPEMDGIDTTIAIRRLGGDYAKVPIIALTANVVSGAREMFIAEGFSDYLAKPIEISKFNIALTKWLPTEKQISKIVEAAEAVTHENIELSIAGVDAKIGIARSGGILENYREILKVFASDGAKRLKEMAGFYKIGDLNLLGTYAHALKSASANIGAVEISDMAAGLEFAGKNGDDAYVGQKLEPFTDALSKVLIEIENYLSDSEQKPELSGNPGDMSYLNESIDRINECLNNVEIEAVEDVLNSLLEYEWGEEILRLLNAMNEGLRIFDYDVTEEAAAELKAICGANCQLEEEFNVK